MICLSQAFHIHIQELRALIDEVELRTREGLRNARIVVCVGSRVVVVGAVAKGRSSSQQLNEHLRRLAVLALAADVAVQVVWVGTEANPSDAASRSRPSPDRTRGLSGQLRTSSCRQGRQPSPRRGARTRCRRRCHSCRPSCTSVRSGRPALAYRVSSSVSAQTDLQRITTAVAVDCRLVSGSKGLRQ